MKVIQIALESASEGTTSSLYALTDDGRIFVKQNIGYQAGRDKEKPWKMIDPILENLQ